MCIFQRSSGCKIENGLEGYKNKCCGSYWETIVVKQQRNHGSWTKKLTVDRKKKTWRYLSGINRSR